MHLPPSQIKAITRLSTRTNLLPVLTKTDLLTSKQLAQVRAVVKRDLSVAGVDLGEEVLMLGDDDDDEDEDASSNDDGEEEEGTEESLERANDGRLIHGTPTTTPTASKPKIIRLRSTRSSPKLNGSGSTSKSFAGGRRRGITARREVEPQAPPSSNTSSMSGGEGEERVVKKEKKLMLPLGLVAPEEEEGEEEEVLEDGEGKRSAGGKAERKFVREVS